MTTKISQANIQPATLEALAGGGGVTTYATVADLPTTNIANGISAYVSANNSMYARINDQWKRFYIGSDASLNVTTEPPTTAIIDFTSSSTKQHTITFQASDPEGFPVTYDYAINPANSPNVQSVTNSSGVYTLQLTGSAQNMGSAVFRASATDGLHVVSRSQLLNFIVATPISLSSGTSTSTVYTAPNGTIVTASDPTYDNSTYKLDWLFNNTTTGATGSYWLSASAATGTLTFNFSNTTLAYLHNVTIYPRTRDDTFTSLTSIQVSTNGVDWNALPNTSMNVTSALPYGFNQTFSLATTTHKYVRLNLSKSGSWGLSLDDVRFTGAI